MKFYVDNLFPSLVVYKDFESVDREIIDCSKEIIKNNSTVPFYSNCQSTVNTKNDILESIEFKNIRKNIIDTVGAFCEASSLSKENLHFQGSWLNLYNPGGYQDLHHHSSSTISGIYYIDSLGEKDLIFQAPWHFYLAKEANVETPNLLNCHNVEYHSTPGRCYVFMSHLMHRTLPATANRISLSFNLIYK